MKWWREKWVGWSVIFAWKVEEWANKRILKYALWFLRTQPGQDSLTVVDSGGTGGGSSSPLHLR